MRLHALCYLTRCITRTISYFSLTHVYTKVHLSKTANRLREDCKRIPVQAACGPGDDVMMVDHHYVVQ